MIYTPERRQGMRLDVPRHLSGSLFESRPTRLLHLSAEGARIAAWSANVPPNRKGDTPEVEADPRAV